MAFNLTPVQGETTTFGNNTFEYDATKGAWLKKEIIDNISGIDTSTSAVSGDVLTYNGTNFVPLAPSGGGGGGSATLDNDLAYEVVSAYTYDGSGNLTTITYAGTHVGYTSNYIYTSGNLTKIEYKDATPTLLLTLDYTYVNGNLDSIART